MTKPWLKFYPADWRADPRLRMCTLAARGLWIDLISYMHEGQPYGHLTIDGVQPALNDIAALVARPVTDVRKALAELEAKQVFSRAESGAIYSRRMVRDNEKAIANVINGYEGGNPNVERGTVPKTERVRPYKRTDAPNKTKRIWDKSNGRCHWCGVDLVWEGTGVEANLFHVDHVVAVKDGGTNDEANLVAAGVMCNRKRTGLGSATCAEAMEVIVGNNSDTKAHIPEPRSQNQKESLSKDFGKLKRDETPPRHGLSTSKGGGRVYIEKGTADWESYAEDYRSVHGVEPNANEHGGKWFKTAGEASAA